MANNILKTFCAAACLGAAFGAMAENVITWESLGNTPDSRGGSYIQRFTVDADQPFERVAFCMFKRGMSPVDPQDTLVEILPGYFAVASPRFEKARKGVPVVVDVKVRGALRNLSYKPDGMHLVADGKPVSARNAFKSTVAIPPQWQAAGRPDGMIYGDMAYAINDSLRSAWRPEAYKQIPTPKKVEYAGSMVAKPDAAKVKVKKIKDSRNDYMRAIIDGDRLTVYTNSKHPQAVVADLMRRIDAAADASGLVPAATIEDWSDMSYRGLMIDVARNFTDAAGMKRIIDLMARYGLNTLHFHLGDDEGWRVEIPELPELTAVGARRGYTTTDDAPFLKGIYSGDGNPDATDTPANGFYTVDEFVDLVRYADGLGIAIIPEFDTPGHSRAAIRAMEQRYRATGDASLRLIHDGDTSKYTSAQDFHDNVMNPALEGPYKFWDIVMGSLAKTYKKAGVKMPVIHIGGDEVPAHAWDGSAAVKELKKKEGYTTQREVFGHFVDRVARIAAKHGMKIAGWQEIARDHSEEYDKGILPHVAAVNCWTNAGDFVPQIGKKGYPLVLTNVDYLYYDQTPTSHPEEPGLTWGGIVDEFRPLHATVDQLCDAPAEVQERVIGVSGTLFAETVRSLGMIERYILPRMLGLAERAHHAKATLADNEFFGAMTAEMPYWAENGNNFYLRQPGIRVTDGKVEMNDAYGLGEIRYTLDGSDPDRNSTLYEGAFPAGGARQVRARLFYGPAQSVTSIYYID